MQVKSLALDMMRRIRYDSAAVRRAKLRGKDLARKIYDGGDYYYKIWPKESKVHKIVFVDGQPSVVSNVADDGSEKLLGFIVKLYNDNVCPAFVKHIYDGDKLVGYATRVGSVLSEDDLSSEDLSVFVDQVIKFSIQSRHILRDLHLKNLIRLPDGRISLIDLETPLAHLDSVDLVEESLSGSLRRGILPQYKRFVLDFFDFRCTSSEILSARLGPVFSNKSTLLRGSSHSAANGKNIDLVLEDYDSSADLRQSPQLIHQWIDCMARELKSY